MMPCRWQLMQMQKSHLMKILYGLSFAYTDDDNVSHQVFFNDAATNFNAMRFGCEYTLQVSACGDWAVKTIVCGDFIIEI